MSQLSSAAFLNLGRSQNGVLGNGLREVLIPNMAAKVEIARNEQFLLLLQCFKTLVFM